MVIKTQVGLIFTQYNASGQPYLTNWVAGLKEQIPSIKIFSNNKIPTQSLPKSIFEIDAPLGKISAVKYLVKRCLYHPLYFIKWLFEKQNVPIKDKAKIWARYAPLIATHPRVIHVVNSPIYPSYDFFIKKFGSVAIISFRGHDTVVRPLSDPGWRESLKKIFQECDFLHYVSNYLRQEGIKLGAPPERSFVIYPGIDLNFYKPSGERKYRAGEEALNLITVGRLVWEKGLINALKAVRVLVDQDYKVNYAIVGDGIEKAHLAFRARELNIENNIIFWGVKPPDQVKKLLGANDIYLQPSITESICVAAMEAGAMELPIIASQVGGLPELVQHGVTGLLVPPDNPEALAEAIMALAENRDKRLEMGQAGRKRVARDFSLEREIGEWVKVYHKALGKVKEKTH